jgi:hypothetical protein
MNRFLHWTAYGVVWTVGALGFLGVLAGLGWMMWRFFVYWIWDVEFRSFAIPVGIVIFIWRCVDYVIRDQERKAIECEFRNREE